ncbi:MAG: hypothetical protein ACHQHN_04080 [Sphingobacteriales bacterium]
MKRALFLIVMLSWFHAHSQQAIKLVDISKIVLNTRGGGLSDEQNVIEVVPVDTGWKCYQTRLIGHDIKARRINDTIRRFKRDISSQTLERLLDIISKKDTNIRKELFKINKSELITFIDSLKTELKPAQRAEFIDSLGSETVVNPTLNTVLHPRRMDDRTYFGITIITKQNTRFTIHAESFADLYDLPWHINNAKSYDPNITAIFESISGFDNYLEHERKYLYKRMVREVYYKYFMTRFAWDNFRSGQPALFAILGNTFTPVTFYTDHDKWFGICTSSLLPQYVHLRFWFKQDDTSAIIKVKRYEDTLGRIFKKNNFLFDYLKANPGYTVELSQDVMTDAGKYIFRDVNKYFEGINKYNYEQSQFIPVYKGRKNVSKWLLLPDDTLILINTIINDKEELLTYKLQLSDSDSFPHNRSVCVVFNADGKIIYNYGFADGITGY